MQARLRVDVGLAPQLLDAQRVGERGAERGCEALEPLELVLGRLPLEPPPEDGERPDVRAVRVGEREREPAGQPKVVARQLLLRVAVRERDGARLGSSRRKRRELAGRLHGREAERCRERHAVRAGEEQHGRRGVGEVGRGLERLAEQAVERVRGAGARQAAQPA